MKMNDVGTYLLSIPPIEALAIAYYCRTDNVRAHADMKIQSKWNRYKKMLHPRAQQWLAMNHKGMI